MRKLLCSFVVGLGLCCAHPSVAMAAQDRKQAAASDPWQDATVTHINRMPMTAHYCPSPRRAAPWPNCAWTTPSASN